ncbi:MAG: UbiX family flavin prenyltransferase [Pirellulaceae bacterium]|nr:UbiX family flavin prenyltransferase [Pirellulaceae bacterium]
MSNPIVLAVTGASGVVYGLRLLQALSLAGRDVHLIISQAGRLVFSDGWESKPGMIHWHDEHDFMAPVASGSFLTDGMVICPCSSSTLGKVAHGTGSNLIHRVADVHLKEQRKLILMPRETPLSMVQLKNMQEAVAAGAVVLPAMPGWYHGVESVLDLVDFIVARLLDQLGIENQLMQRWGKQQKHDETVASNSGDDSV